MASRLHSEHLTRVSFEQFFVWHLYGRWESFIPGSWQAWLSLFAGLGMPTTRRCLVDRGRWRSLTTLSSDESGSASPRTPLVPISLFANDRLTSMYFRIVYLGTFIFSASSRYSLQKLAAARSRKCKIVLVVHFLVRAEIC